MEGRAKRQAQPERSSPAGTTVKCRQNRGQVSPEFAADSALHPVPRRGTLIRSRVPRECKIALQGEEP